MVAIDRALQLIYEYQIDEYDAIVGDKQLAISPESGMRDERTTGLDDATETRGGGGL